MALLSNVIINAKTTISMKKKLIYEAPAMELIQVRFEQNIMSVNHVQSSSPEQVDMVAGSWD